MDKVAILGGLGRAAGVPISSFGNRWAAWGGERPFGEIPPRTHYETRRTLSRSPAAGPPKPGGSPGRRRVPGAVSPRCDGRNRQSLQGLTCKWNGVPAQNTMGRLGVAGTRPKGLPALSRAVALRTQRAPPAALSPPGTAKPREAEPGFHAFPERGGRAYRILAGPRAHFQAKGSGTPVVCVR